MSTFLKLLLAFLLGYFARDFNRLLYTQPITITEWRARMRRLHLGMK
jgi:hypothetical protein